MFPYANIEIPLPAGYSCREVLCAIGTICAGNFIISDEGKLLLVRMNVEPKNRVLSNENDYVLMFGDTAIYV